LLIERGAVTVAVNLGDRPAELSAHGAVLLATRDGVETRNGAAVRLPGCAAVILG
jgi:hypothetical protein